MIEKRRPQTKRASAVTPDPMTASDRYWRTFRRKFGENLELAGKALVAAGAAAMLAPLATKSEINVPTLTVAAIFVAGLAVLLIGLHLQAKAKPDE
jgi:hypothetical protein